MFAEKEIALEIARKREALNNSKVWSDYITKTSEEDFEALIHDILELLGYEQLFPNYMIGEDLTSYVEELVLPSKEDKVDLDIVPIDHYPILAQEMMTLIPSELQDEMGRLDRDDDREFYLFIDPEHLEKVLYSMQLLGYELEENQTLIEKAEGLKAN